MSKEPLLDGYYNTEYAGGQSQKVKEVIVSTSNIIISTPTLSQI